MIHTLDTSQQQALTLDIIFFLIMKKSACSRLEHSKVAGGRGGVDTNL